MPHILGQILELKTIEIRDDVCISYASWESKPVDQQARQVM